MDSKVIKELILDRGDITRAFELFQIMSSFSYPKIPVTPKFYKVVHTFAPLYFEKHPYWDIGVADLLDIVSADCFQLPEIEILHLIVKWCSKNDATGAKYQQLVHALRYLSSRNSFTYFHRWENIEYGHILKTAIESRKNILDTDLLAILKDKCLIEPLKPFCMLGKVYEVSSIDLTGTDTI